MLATGERPRELHWYHAGPMLFGDWGTSRLYVLGLAFAFNGRASFWFVALMSVLLIGVGWSYEIICRLFPDGGGVYSSARHRSQLLAVIGGLLLCADYVVTASLSCLDAFHYLEAALGFHGLAIFGMPIEAILAAITILLIGGLNYFGPAKAGTVAMFIAMATVALTLVIGVRAVLHMTGLVPIHDPAIGPLSLESPLKDGVWKSWIGFTEIVLALSGVEAIANMTGIMVQPVQKTARKSIIPVLIEIVLLNLILAAAMNTLPDSILYSAPKTPAHTDDMLKVIAVHYVGETFAKVASVVFAALLLSAVNTALADLVSIQFMLSRDKELPKVFSGLNNFGMPMLPLLIAAIVPAVVVLVFPNVTVLSGLYAIGVVGAIAINLGTTSTNFELALKGHERLLMMVLTVVMIAIESTICVVKPDARGFALLVLVTGLAGRLVTIVTNRAVPLTKSARTGYVTFAVAAIATEVLITVLVGHTWMGFGLSALVAVVVGAASYRTQAYRAALIAAEHAAGPAVTAKKPSMIQPGAYTPKERIMVATQGNPKLIEFAIKECKNRQAELDILFVRHLAVTPMGPTIPPKLEEDEQALSLFERLREQAKNVGVPLRLLYGVARDIPDAILDMAVTHGADLLLLGTTRRGTLWKAMKGDVIQAVAEQLPGSIDLLIHAGTPDNEA
ncbi:universal stress protein [Singulisphaera sp. PoT]|uniref:universal stress protein n=1 Tax=Singulisphaera sp. PoT TaxID=3411797 RepID=UPI003BF53DAC